ncbi:ANK_REP_REGION domain-containing protein [Meloidogyne graminicola]|uniref:ANK_REP_REGION domain-containing protein n=1 Tax=Meloidogyne graminicola TaxID=189291 RepID=A0A8T0A262_9BILA|nr:ANK_REP_REGION domain-containing protein [Meloidogyne graminicola]
MSQLLNKLSKFHKNKSSENTFIDKFLAMPFKPQTLVDNRLDIHFAASLGAYGINPSLVNATDRRGWTPLMYAAQAGDVEVCKLLLMNGALVECKNTEGENAKDLASDWGHAYVVNLLNQKNISA